MSFINDPTRAFSPLLKLTAFSDAQMTKEVGSLLLPYDATAMDSTYSNIICDPKTIGAQSGTGTYKGTKSSDLRVSFLLDDTTYSNLVAYALPAILITDSVDAIVKKLLSYCYSQNETTGEPNYLLLKPYGMPLVDSPGGGFKGRLLTMNIKNEIVSLLGDRVKAKIDCTFKESLSPEQLNKTMAATVK
ncbi:MAG: hypothetical protein RPT25_06970 [Cycloclasticus sp.]|jgi:hypothetical protein